MAEWATVQLLRKGFITIALRAGDAEGLLTLLRSAEWSGDLDGFCSRRADIAAERGHTECLRVLDMCGVELPSSTWTRAAAFGHVDCLAFAMSQGYALDDYALEHAIDNGHLACVDFLTQQGLPHKPYRYGGAPIGPDQMKCLQLVADRGVDINPSSMMAAVESGELDLVRWLHQHGVPLWRHAVCKKVDSSMYKEADKSLADNPETLLIPGRPRVEGMWKALRYGAVLGAPVIPLVEDIFNEKRRRSRAVLKCFKVVERRIKAPLPSALVEEILILADLEIWEAMVGPRLLKHHLP